mmetsp:Transcript_29883/g.85247  ORF Transcript_29883/g.85247 Transcript_29883/m.85247 type:complete len:273 (-) Transcript_29883:757-1575(-)
MLARGRRAAWRRRRRGFRRNHRRVRAPPGQLSAGQEHASCSYRCKLRSVRNGCDQDAPDAPAGHACKQSAGCDVDSRWCDLHSRCGFSQAARRGQGHLLVLVVDAHIVCHDRLDHGRRPHDGLVDERLADISQVGARRGLLPLARCGVLELRLCSLHDVRVCGCAQRGGVVLDDDGVPDPQQRGARGGAGRPPLLEVRLCDPRRARAAGHGVDAQGGELGDEAALGARLRRRRRPQHRARDYGARAAPRRHDLHGPQTQHAGRSPAGLHGRR